MSLNEIIYEYALGHGRFSVRELVDFVSDKYDYSSSYIVKQLQDLVAKGTMRRTCRGMYELNIAIKPRFSAYPDNDIKSLYNHLKEQFPFVNFCIWNVRDLLPLMHDVPNVRMTIVYCDKVAVTAVSEAIVSITDRLVLPSPDEYVLENLAYGREVIVVNPLISRSPIVTLDGVPCPRLEKILVDILCDKELAYVRGMESLYIYATALENYRLNIKTLKRYASRRNRDADVEELLQPETYDS